MTALQLFSLQTLPFPSRLLEVLVYGSVNFTCLSYSSSFHRSIQDGVNSANLAKGFFIANASSTTITVTIKNKPKAFPSRISNKPPYIACPMGVAHIPIHMAQDITFPIRLPGTIICKYDMICIENSVARNIIIKQLTIMIP